MVRTRKKSNLLPLQKYATRRRSSSSPTTNEQQNKEKKKRNASPALKVSRDTRNKILNPIIDEIIEEEEVLLKQQKNHRPTYGLITKYVEQYKSALPWINSNILKKE